MARYLVFGLHGHHALVPWIWTAIVCNLIGTVLFFLPAALERGAIRICACLFCIAGIWIEKGMGLIILTAVLSGQMHQQSALAASPDANAA